MRARSGLAALLALAAVAMTACSGDLAPPAAEAPAAPAVRACAAPADDAPAGRLVAAYPDEPAAWLPALHGDAAAIDLAALWGLPLYAHDADGQLVPALVAGATPLGRTEDGWSVRLELCPGSWSDGEPVVAEDVVATVDALLAAGVTTPIVAARADGPDAVVTLAAEQARWQHALADLGPVLPAHVLADGGLEAFRDDVPVAGGPFALADVEPGLARRFVAHAGSPLGAPAVAELEVALVPRFELALGLAAEGRADVLLGHLALEGGPRIEGVEGIEGRVARGNTVLSWAWNATTTTTDAQRRAVVDGLDLTAFAEGLLTGDGRLVRSFVPAVEGPPVPPPQRLPDGLGELVVSTPRWHDLTSLVARGARDGLERRGATVRTATEEADLLARAPIGDATVRVRRLGAWPSLTALVDPTLSGLEAADLAPTVDGEAADLAAVAVWDLAAEVPLVEVGVAHAWRAGVTGVEPSGWPGIGFASARHWRPAA